MECRGCESVKLKPLGLRGFKGLGKKKTGVIGLEGLSAIWGFEGMRL